MTKKDENKRENRKALWFFIPIFIVSLLAGFLGGHFAVNARKDLQESLSVSIDWAIQNVMPWGTVLSFVLSLAIYFPLYGSAKKIFAAWDREDEAVIEKAEHKLELLLLWQSILQVLCYFCFGCCAAYIKRADTTFHWITILASLSGMVASLIAIPMTQRRVVDLVKEINPEKKGSIYDMKFSKKWLDSCDEAEKVMIYKSGYMAFKVTTYTCLVLWMVLVILSISFTMSILALACVSLIWLLQTLTYMLYSMKLGQTPPPMA